jgi:ABC-type antimicrobial peptide transport system permease subunit
MLFLLSAYRGVADGSVEYIRQNKADLWVLQRSATNILRGSSVLFDHQGKIIREITGVQSVSPVLLLLSAIKKESLTATVFLTGFDPVAGLGGPPQLVEGRSVLTGDEIVLDEAFAAKFGFKVGDSVRIQDDILQVVGISTGTNAFVIQYAFVTLQQAQSLIGIPGVATTYLIASEGGADIMKIAQEIREKLPDVEAYDHETFLQNNIREMQSGFLPFIYTVASIGIVVLTAILSLLLSINILESRKDFAVLKTLGSPSGLLSRLIVEQSLLISSMGIVTGLVFYFPMVALIEWVSPEVSTKLSVEQIAVVVLVVAVVSLVSSFISMQRLRRIYPVEAFS